jgi:predicted DNA-binding protein (MmcQ/YjbR family)
MKKDISFLPVEGVKIAVVKKNDPKAAFDWVVYLLNENEVPITNVIVASRGYGFKGEEQQKTSILRHVIGEVAARDYAVIESIDPGVFHLNNEYWVSYYINGQVYDKKFIFVPESITEANLSRISQLDLEGVVHQ